MPDLLGGASSEERARLSWLFPLLAWGSQIVFTITLRHASGFAMGIFWTLVAVIQFVLLVAGLSLGIRVLSQGRSAVSRGAWIGAWLGVVLSGGTFLLIGALMFGSR